MNPLLLTLEASGLGLSMSNLYGGAYLHADDIRTLATSVSTLQAQISEVLKFTSNNFLQLNPAKCEIVSFAQHNSVDDPVCKIEGKLLPASGTAKCLGYLWNHNLSAKPSIEHNILIGIINVKIETSRIWLYTPSCCKPQNLSGSEQLRVARVMDKNCERMSDH